MKLQKEVFSNIKELPTELLKRLDRMFGRIFDNSEYIDFTVRTFVDATSGNVDCFLPSGFSPTGKDYYIVKTDSSANTVTIRLTDPTENILGVSTYVLAAQYDNVTLTFEGKTWYVR